MEYSEIFVIGSTDNVPKYGFSGTSNRLIGYEVLLYSTLSKAHSNSSRHRKVLQSKVIEKKNLLAESFVIRPLVEQLITTPYIQTLIGSNDCRVCSMFSHS